MIGGTHRQMLYLIARIDRTKFEPIVCTHLTNEGGLKEDFYSLNIKIYNLARKSKLDISIFTKLRRILIDENISRIVIFEPQNLIYFRVARLFMSTKIKQIGLLRAMGFWLGHKYSYLKPLDAFLAQWLIKTSAVVIANSESVKKYHSHNLKKTDHKIQVIYNLSDFNFNIDFQSDSIRTSLGILSEDFVCVMVARLDPWKDFYTLLRAAILIKKKSMSIKFIICGGGELYQDLLSFINNNDLSQTVMLVGERKNVYDYINAADIVIHTTYGEGFSNAILEGMSLKKTILATDIDSNSEILGKNNEYGYLIPSHNYQVLAEIIIKLKEDQVLTEQMNLKGYERIQYLCNFEKNIKQYEKYFSN